MSALNCRYKTGFHLKDRLEQLMLFPTVEGVKWAKKLCKHCIISNIVFEQMDWILNFVLPLSKCHVVDAPILYTE